MVLTSDEDYNHGGQSRNDKADVDGDIGEPDEPSIASTTFEFASTLGTCDGSCWVLASDAYTGKEAVGCQSREQATGTTASAICACSESIEDEQNNLCI